MNDLDPLLHDAMARVRGPVDARPSLTDVRRRARRHNRRRMTATVGAVAFAGVATTALIIRRDSEQSTVSGQSGSTGLDVTDSTTGIFLDATTTYPMQTTVPMAVDVTIDSFVVWDALSNLQTDPSAEGIVYPAEPVIDQMPSADAFGCSTPQSAAMFNYVVWHELAQALGFPSVQHLQEMNPGIDYAQPPRAGDVVHSVLPSSSPLPPPTNVYVGDTTTTMSMYEGVTLIDGGAPAGAMEDAYQRLAGYNRTIVPSSGKTVEQTIVMPIGGDNTSLASAVAAVFGIDGFDSWDPSLVGAPVEGLAAIVIGPDYFDRVQNATVPTITTPPTSTTTTIVG